MTQQSKFVFEVRKIDRKVDKIDADCVFVADRRR